MKTPQSKMLFELHYVVLIGLIALCGCDSKATLESVEDSQTRGNQIVDALEAFHKKNGYYPESLNSLIPIYIAVLPPPEWGTKQWRYSQGDGAFVLSVNESSKGHPTLYFRSADRRWVFDE